MLDIIGVINEYGREMGNPFHDVWTDLNNQYVSFDLMDRKFEALNFNGKYNLHEVVWDSWAERWINEGNYDTRGEFLQALREIVYVPLTAVTYEDRNYWVIEVPELQGMMTQALVEDDVAYMACDLASAIYDKPIELFRATVVYKKEGNENGSS